MLISISKTELDARKLSLVVSTAKLVGQNTAQLDRIQHFDTILDWVLRNGSRWTSPTNAQLLEFQMPEIYTAISEYVTAPKIKINGISTAQSGPGQRANAEKSDSARKPHSVPSV